jgi:ferrous iron transport protein B
MENYKIALAGNPNCGKTSLFNALTGSNQRIGNWPGVTVERKEGFFQNDSKKYKLIDLPGIYSFSAFSLDEKVAREYILEEKPDLVVNIVDASNLERNLYLTVQLMEMKVPMLVALNMMDLAEKNNLQIDIERLEEHLGCPVVPIVASKKTGIEQLKIKIDEAVQTEVNNLNQVEYQVEMEEIVDKLAKASEKIAQENKLDSRWLAIKLLEDDELAVKLASKKLIELTKQQQEYVSRMLGNDTDIAIADDRYGFIHGLVKDVTRKSFSGRKNITDIIDSVVLNRILGVPIFLGVMYLVFCVTINLGSIFIDFFDILFGTIFVDGLSYILSSISVPDLLTTILADGIGGGLQTVATFIPPIFFIFLFLSLLEDSGYMSRAAFVMDRFLRFIGLPGKSFIPMLVGFGCNVPAIMATRTLENNKDRILTILINPFISCGARLPVYILFATVFFPKHGASLIFSIYIIGILLAILSGLLFKKTILRGETSSFVMELPPYHFPTFNGIMFHTWQRLKSFILRAGKVIMIVVIVLSFLNSIGTDGSFGNQDSENSILSYVGKKITPIFRPMGINDDNWPATVGLFTGIFAKETVVGTLDNLYSIMGDEPDTDDFDFWNGVQESFLSIKNGFIGLGSTLSNPIGIEVDEDLSVSEEQARSQEVSINTFKQMRQKFGSTRNAFAYLLFILIYVPCVATIAAIYRETNWRWTLFSVSYLTGLAWIVATLYYQIASFAIQPKTSTFWIVLNLFIMYGIYKVLKLLSNKKIHA